MISCVESPESFGTLRRMTKLSEKAGLYRVRQRSQHATAVRFGNRISFLLEAFSQLNEQFQQGGLFLRQIIFALRRQPVDVGGRALVFGFNLARQDIERQLA